MERIKRKVKFKYFLIQENMKYQIDTNIDFQLKQESYYYADPRIEENGLNRALRIDYIV